MRWARYYIRKLFHNSSGNKPTHPPGGFLRNKPVGTFHFPTGTCFTETYLNTAEARHEGNM